MPANRPRRALLVLIASLAIWTALSYAFISMFAGSNVCSIVEPVVAGQTSHPLTQAEMDAHTARCNRPNLETLTISAAGYILIVGVLATRSARELTRRSQ